MKTKCNVCHHQCELSLNQTGFCGARKNENGKIAPINYGIATSLALDPIEKKPLAMFYPGSKILSIGSFGCNLACPFCQNYSISKEFSVGESEKIKKSSEYISPSELLEKALELREFGNIGIAFTYNEPLTCYEFVRDTAELFHENGLKNVIVTNGCFSPEIFDEVLPYIGAMNIDLKTFSDEGYKKLGGDLETVKKAIQICTSKTHVELTTLIVPGLNDSEEEMRAEVEWISSINKEIPLHITRFFPRYKMQTAAPTEISKIQELAAIARETLPNVFTGNC